ncbi:hypothetical protein [Micromonospora viridifaciens]|uniref:hypothetical protein n=1 Tax=Micromonospora viridifaciens TaxID=1881 RepID=UPI001E411CB8|nr:hypothetical protein [Micromonospora viridifaciens]
MTLIGMESSEPPPVPLTCIVARAPLVAGASSLAEKVKVTVCDPPSRPKSMAWLQPLQLTPSGRPAMLRLAVFSLLSGVTSMRMRLLPRPASMVTELPEEEEILAAWAGVAGTVSRAPTTSATTTPARRFQARRCVVTSTAFRV